MQDEQYQRGIYWIKVIRYIGEVTLKNVYVCGNKRYHLGDKFVEVFTAPYQAFVRGSNARSKCPLPR